MKGSAMPQSLSKMVVHLTFSTKDRRPLITSEIREELRAYLGGTLRDMDCPSLVIGAVADHVHILFVLSRKHSLAEVVEEIKKTSSKWIKGRGEALGEFYWQRGYGAFSVSQSKIEDTKAYIASQEEHHREVSFQDDFRAFLVRHEIDFDERYVWD
ncbi:hypothetical protein LCGC14_0562950 [marine sediment metagenome]|uniref:Transposase IS200-like domain-containing protein n=1 Tax=marine sediment metagenome TaxID=412755 RepID=A0A0F9UUQ7_9ZZZZ